MLKFNQYLEESLGVLKMFPDYLARHIAKNFRVGHDAIVKKISDTNKLVDYEMSDDFLGAVMDFGAHIPVVLDLGNEEYVVFSINPMWDEELDPERRSFFEGNYDVFHKGKLIKQNYGAVEEAFPRAKGVLIYPSASRMNRVAQRWQQKSGPKGYTFKQTPYSPYQLLFDQRVDELNKIAGTPLLKKHEAHGGASVSYGWVAPDRFSKALKASIGHVPFDRTHYSSTPFVTFTNTSVTNFSKIKYEIEKINRVIAAVKKYG